jgi:hypothetical protein
MVYCSKKCQVDHYGLHKRACKIIAEKAAADSVAAAAAKPACADKARWRDDRVKGAFDPKRDACSYCGIIGAALACSTCDAAIYCSPECRFDHRSAHRASCAAAASKRAKCASCGRTRPKIRCERCRAARFCSDACMTKATANGGSHTQCEPCPRRPADVCSKCGKIGISRSLVACSTCGARFYCGAECAGADAEHASGACAAARDVELAKLAPSGCRRDIPAGDVLGAIGKLRFVSDTMHDDFGPDEEVFVRQDHASIPIGPGGRPTGPHARDAVEIKSDDGAPSAWMHREDARRLIVARNRRTVERIVSKLRAPDGASRTATRSRGRWAVVVRPDGSVEALCDGPETSPGSRHAISKRFLDKLVWAAPGDRAATVIHASRRVAAFVNSESGSRDRPDLVESAPGRAVLAALGFDANAKWDVCLGMPFGAVAITGGLDGTTELGLDAEDAEALVAFARSVSAAAAAKSGTTLAQDLGTPSDAQQALVRNRVLNRIAVP